METMKDFVLYTKQWHSINEQPLSQVFCAGFDEKHYIHLYDFDPMFGWLMVSDYGLIHCIPPVYWCAIPNFDGDK